MGLGPRDVERATEVTRSLPAGGFQPSGTRPRRPRANSWKGSRAPARGSARLVPRRTWSRAANASRGGREPVGLLLAARTQLSKDAGRARQAPCLLWPKNWESFARNGGAKGRCRAAIHRGSSTDLSRAVLLYICRVLARGLSNCVSTVRLFHPRRTRVLLQLSLVEGRGEPAPSCVTAEIRWRRVRLGFLRCLEQVATSLLQFNASNSAMTTVPHGACRVHARTERSPRQQWSCK